MARREGMGMTMSMVPMTGWVRFSDAVYFGVGLVAREGDE